ncbi:MAG: hypothetical protein DMG05_29415 [Acidobacteria bacterium]|nr:MAG: hypothetical protein DMG05_29415 [Acidobacteriota bacterium]
MRVEITTPFLPIEEIAKRAGVTQTRAAELIAFAKRLVGKSVAVRKHSPKKASKRSLVRKVAAKKAS